MTRSVDFPIANPIQGTGGGEAFVTKISNAPLPAVTLAIVADSVVLLPGGTPGYNVTATNPRATQQCF